LFKWFLGLASDARAFDASSLSTNRRRLLDHEIADRFFAEVFRAVADHRSWTSRRAT
jgi:hypothetical protein